MKKNNKGFTLAELLIVVAIIAVLVAIAIPVFTSQLEKSREATDLANIRSAYASAIVKYLDDGKDQSITVTHQQKVNNWQSGPSGNNSTFTLKGFSDGGNYSITVPGQAKDYTVKVASADGKVTITQ